MKTIFAESPETEQWRILQTYTYSSNIERYFNNKGLSYDNKTIEIISGSILQAQEYFNTSIQASLYTRSLLLYYGVSNLLLGILGLHNGKTEHITDHGMKIIIPPEYSKIAEIQIRPCNEVSGALSIFLKMFDDSLNICHSGDWTISELLGSIPEILDDFLLCYQGHQPYCIPLEIKKNKQNVVERIQNNYLNNFSEPFSFSNDIRGFKANYLSPQYIGEYVILRRKLDYNEIGIFHISGKKHLQVLHLKNSKKIALPIEIYMFMILFSLSYVSRYHSEIWNPFVSKDATGEKLIIERFLDSCRRLFPNYMLNYLEKENIRFTNSPQGITDTSTQLTEQEVIEIVNNMDRRK
ncbi:YaaC family protein [Clostridium sp. KNHs216]|uniref:YaaC family protein n=1 Tax=Clostridium sp. KNHs216 TaxID=1550235 RepID=UPI001151E3FA|nr:YaaC family protein [Clostridium sp. KNHs216]TQI66711.1 YaaC-like protein [Clostridium sp. KNHs216]